MLACFAVYLHCFWLVALSQSCLERLYLDCLAQIAQAFDTELVNSMDTGEKGLIRLFAEKAMTLMASTMEIISKAQKPLLPGMKNCNPSLPIKTNC